MDVTEQILAHHQIYGSSDSTSQSYVASGQCFNYSKGNTIQKPIEYGVSVFPFKADLKGEVGLFGAENVFFKFNVNVKDSATFCLEEPGWVCADIDQSLQPINPADEYTFNPINNSNVVQTQGQAYISYEDVLDTSPGYLPADLNFPNYIKNYNEFSVYLENRGTNNIYVDSHIDGRLYKVNKEEHPYELMYIAAKDCVYVGIHARNTKRLPFDMTIYFGYETIGKTPPVPVELKSPCCSATATPVY